MSELLTGFLQWVTWLHQKLVLSFQSRGLGTITVRLGEQEFTQDSGGHSHTFINRYNSVSFNLFLIWPLTFCFCFCRAASKDSSWNCFCVLSFFSLSSWTSISWIFCRAFPGSPSFHSSTAQLMVSTLKKHIHLVSRKDTGIITSLFTKLITAINC